ncbi:MAG: hypothetical protein R6V19_02785, partial [Armatimonadota bacterium]
MNRLQEANLSEIRSLNQRGGRTLSIMDLIADGTLTKEMAAYLLAKVASGNSFLTAAQASGTGKSTLLANLLGFLPPAERIISTASADVIRRGHDNDDPSCYLAHEIGSGHWYGYIWGETVREYFTLAGSGHRLASCLHADTMPQLKDQLMSPPIGITEDRLQSIGLICFMRMIRPRGSILRRVWSIEALVDGHYETAWGFDQDTETFVESGAADTLTPAEKELYGSAHDLIADFVASQFHDFEGMRR